MNVSNNTVYLLTKKDTIEKAADEKEKIIDETVKYIDDDVGVPDDVDVSACKAVLDEDEGWTISVIPWKDIAIQLAKQS